MFIVVKRNSLIIMNKISSAFIFVGCFYLFKEVLLYKSEFETLFKFQKKFYKKVMNKEEVKTLYKNSKRVSEDHLKLIIQSALSNDYNKRYNILSTPEVTNSNSKSVIDLKKSIYNINNSNKDQVKELVKQ